MIQYNGETIYLSFPDFFKPGMSNRRTEDELLPRLSRVLRRQAVQQLLPQCHERLPGLSHRDPGAVGPFCW